MTGMFWIICYLSAVSLAAFFLFGLDKWKAQTGRWRIPETTLWAITLAGGAIGSLAGMLLFRHKTRHLQFRIGIPLILALQLFLLFRYFSN